MTKVAEYSGSNLVFQLALTESNIEENWQNQTHLHWVERLMAPSANGTPLDFSSSDTQSFTLNFTIDPSWDIEFCELAGFVQANSSKEVMQTKLSILATPEFSVDAEVLNIFDTPEESCSGKMAPKVTIRNRGEEHLTSLEVEYTVNNSAPVSYNWTGDLDFLGKDSFELPEITFEEAETNVVEVTVLNPNGQEDQNPNNNVTTTEVASAETIDPVSYLILRTDNNPQETTWELTNSAGEVIYNGGPYSEPMKMNRDTFQLYTTDCYRITIYDSGNNGLCCGSGTGFVRVINSDMQTVVYAMEFTDKYVGEFNVNSIGISALSQEFAVEIYPNPLNDVANIVLNLREASEVQITAFDLMGKKVLEQNEGKLPEGTSTLTLDATNLTKGVYILRIHAGESVLSQKITIK
ncbi:MAG: hypothetical protein CSA04_02900 [Bacteroidetes bacterium]|nr:MAG: hypothetical protein CSA04_02900 [Bacteroidota bacterium]